MTTLGALASFPLRSDWEQAELDRRYPDGRPYRYTRSATETYRDIFLGMLATPEPFPAPVATTRDSHDLPARPTPVAGLVAAVESDGWATLVQHSAGHVPHATHGRPGAAPVEHWAVRMHRGHRGALAMRKGAAWEFFYVWSKDGFIRSTALAQFYETLRFTAELDGLPSAAQRRWGPA